MRRTRVPAMILLVVLAVSGCSATSGASSDSPGLAPVEQGADGGPGTAGSGGTDFSGAGSDAAESGAADSSAGGLASGLSVEGDAAATDRQVVTTGTMSLIADDPIDAGEKAAGIVEAAGGRVDGRTETAPSRTTEDGAAGSPDGTGDGSADSTTTTRDGGHSTLVLRIPSAELTATIEALKALGDVVSVQTSAQDVTIETQDLDARIAALDASVTRLLALLTSATDTKALVDLETAISSRQGELESMQAQRRYLSDQVSMSAITLDIGSLAEAPVETPDTFWDAVAAGFTGFGVFFTGVVLVAGYLIPWLLLVGVGSLVVLLVLRRRRRTSPAEPDVVTSD